MITGGLYPFNIHAKRGSRTGKPVRSAGAFRAAFLARAERRHGSGVSLRWVLSALLCASAGSAAFGAPAVIALPGKAAFPESIASTRDGTLYVSSLGAGGIYRVQPRHTKAEIWIQPGAFGSRSIFGVVADERTHMLWACSNDMTFAGVPTPGSDSGSYLKGFDLRSGSGKASIKLPDGPSVCNDIAIARDGTIFVTNTAAPQILRLVPGGTQFEVWLNDPALQPPGHAGGLDGIAFGDDGNLYVGNTGRGELYRIEVKGDKPGAFTTLHLSRPLAAPDAIRPLGGQRFLVTENGGRLSRIAVRGDDVAIETLREGFDTPTGVATIGQVAWVTEGQLGYVFDPSKKNQPPRLPFRIYAVALPR